MMAVNGKNKRMKYCSLNSCENFRGTIDQSVHMFKIPKDGEVAKQWLRFLGIESQTSVCGFVCNKHFKDEFMNKNKTRLLANAAPTFNISAVSTIQLAISRAPKAIEVIDENEAFEAFIEEEVVEELEEAGNQSIPEISSTCRKCEEREKVLKCKDEEIRSLKNELKKAKKKVWYLETTKRNLRAALTNMKKEKIIDEEQFKLLEVIR